METAWHSYLEMGDPISLAIWTIYCTFFFFIVLHVSGRCDQASCVTIVPYVGCHSYALSSSPAPVYFRIWSICLVGETTFTELSASRELHLLLGEVPAGILGKPRTESAIPLENVVHD